jgi:hypothetical protein
MRILDPGRKTLDFASLDCIAWGFNLGCRRWLGGDLIESIGQAISRAQAQTA